MLTLKIKNLVRLINNTVHRYKQRKRKGWDHSAIYKKIIKMSKSLYFSSVIVTWKYNRFPREFFEEAFTSLHFKGT